MTVPSIGVRLLAWDDRALISGLYYEQFARGAFALSLARDPHVPLLLWHESHRFPIGVADAAHWADTSTAMVGRFQVDDHSENGSEALRLARLGLLRAVSIGFQPVHTRWEAPAGRWNPELGVLDTAHRTEARLLEVSLVVAGAYQSAKITDVDGRQISRSLAAVG